MPSSAEALYILIILLPGFLVVSLTEILTGLRCKETHRLLIYALASSFVVYVCYVLLSGLGLPNIKAIVTSAMDSKVLKVGFSINATILGLATLFIISLVVGIIISSSINFDWLRLVRKMGFTRVSFNALVWDGVFRSKEHWVLVKLTTGEVVIGWPKRSSVGQTKYSLSLQDASWVLPDGTTQSIGADEFLIVGDIQWVQIHKKKENKKDLAVRC